MMEMSIILSYLLGAYLSGLIFCIMTRLGDIPPCKWYRDEWMILIFALFLSWVGVIVFSVLAICIFFSKIDFESIASFLSKERPISNLFKRK